jgi:DNA-binding HxlR family transcriptional regulator
MPMREFEPIILDEDCAPRRVLELFSVKWTTMVLHSLHFNGGTCRTGALARSLPGCSKKMLTQTLREMERDRLIDRKVYPVVPPMVEYSPNAHGPALHRADRDALWSPVASASGTAGCSMSIS